MKMWQIGENSDFSVSPKFRRSVAKSVTLAALPSLRVQSIMRIEGATLIRTYWRWIFFQRIIKNLSSGNKFEECSKEIYIRKSTQFVQNFPKITLQNVRQFWRKLEKSFMKFSSKFCKQNCEIFSKFLWSSLAHFP